MKIPKTNAMRLLDGLDIPYQAWPYPANGATDGLAVAALLGRAPDQLFKTLVACGPAGEILVFCIPVSIELDLKLAARAAGVKSVAMLPQAKLLATTGYVHGGVSPLAMKKAYPTRLHHSALAHPTVLVSAGRVGLQMELAPPDLLRAAQAEIFGGGAEGA